MIMTLLNNLCKWIEEVSIYGFNSTAYEFGKSIYQIYKHDQCLGKQYLALILGEGVAASKSNKSHDFEHGIIKMLKDGEGCLTNDEIGAVEVFKITVVTDYSGISNEEEVAARLAPRNTSNYIDIRLHDSYSFCIRDEFRVLLARRYKPYELQKVTAMEKYLNHSHVRERSLTNSKKEISVSLKTCCSIPLNHFISKERYLHEIIFLVNFIT